jgi:hypothetical protein
LLLTGRKRRKPEAPTQEWNSWEPDSVSCAVEPEEALCILRLTVL